MSYYKLNYQPSNGNSGAEPFNRVSAGLVKLAAANPNYGTYIIPEFTPVSDQGSASSCAANSACDILEMLKGLEDPSKVVQVSRLFAYYNARSIEGTQDQDAGCYIHDIFQSMKNIGVCPESDWIYDISRVLVHPPMQAYKVAADNKIENFYEITSSGKDRLNDIETAIRANHPCSFGTDIGNELETYDGDINTIFDYPTNAIGGHAMACVGVRHNQDGSRSFLIRNSWGNSFGLKNYPGHFYMSDSYMANPNTRDIFVPTRMIDFQA